MYKFYTEWSRNSNKNFLSFIKYNCASYVVMVLLQKTLQKRREEVLEFKGENCFHLSKKIYLLMKWRHSVLFKKIYLFIHLFLAALGLCCCAQAFSRCGERGLLFVAVRGLLIAVASLAAEHGLKVHRLSCSTAYGIFPDQTSNPCPLHWQVDS